MQKNEREENDRRGRRIYVKKRIYNHIIKRIIEYCDLQQLSINKLAEKSNMTQSTLQSIISGDTENPTILTITKICLGLNISLNEFFEDF